jgi:hypothetical protein
MKPIASLTRRHFVKHAVSAVGLALAGLPLHARPTSPRRHWFLCCDYQGGKVAIVSAEGTVEWEFAAETPQDCWLLANGNVLFCHKGGARIVTPAREVAWEYRAPAGAQCHSCQPLLEDGQVLVAECGLSRLVLVGRDGQVDRKIKVASQAKNMGHQFRGSRRTAKGHYLVCLMDEKKIVELAADGALLREMPVEGDPHAAVLLPNGHLLVTLGPAAKVIEFDRKMKPVWRIDGEDLPGNPLRLPAGCQRLRNGNTIICNYLPGGFMGKQPQAFEVTRDKKVVWEFADHARFKTVNQIFVLDAEENRGKRSPLR